jgi:hypothetical protein
MATDVTPYRGQGPEIMGMRLTVYHLLPYFLDPEVTESYICRVYNLGPEEVAAARAYVLNNADVVLAQHMRIEERIEEEIAAQERCSELAAQREKTRETFRKFREWTNQRKLKLAREQAEYGGREGAETLAPDFPTFQEWLAQQDSQSGSRS